MDPAFGRNQGPFLTRDMWREVLVEAGYSGVDIMFDNFAVHKDAAVIVATARDEGIPTSLPLPPTHGFSLVITLNFFLLLFSLSFRGSTDELNRSTETSHRHSLMGSANTFRLKIFRSSSSH